MNIVTRKGANYNIVLSLSFDDAKDIIEAIEMAENEGVYNKASALKTTLEDLLRPCVCKNCNAEISRKEYNARDGVCRKCWGQVTYE